MGVSERIKKIRKDKGFKQMDVAARLGMDASNYNRLEKRGEELTLTQLRDIAQALNVPLSNLLNDNEEQKVIELYGYLSEKYRSRYNDVLFTTEYLHKVADTIIDLAKVLKIGEITYTDTKGHTHKVPVQEIKYHSLWGAVISEANTGIQHYGVDSIDKEELKEIIGMIINSLNQFIWPEGLEDPPIETTEEVFAKNRAFIRRMLADD